MLLLLAVQLRSTVHERHFALFILLLLLLYAEVVVVVVLLLGLIVLPSLVPTLILPILMLLNAIGELLDRLTKLIGYLCVLSCQLAMLVPTSLFVTPIGQVHLLECVQSISCLLHIIVDPVDTVIDGVPLNRILLVRK